MAHIFMHCPNERIKMAEITKWQSTQILPVLKHNMRNLSDGNISGNDAIDPSLTPNNYDLINRGSTCTEINQYRKDIEKQCFKYNRKNIVHALEMVIQCPSDCSSEQEDIFFREAYNYVCSTLPMGERCIFAAQVHKDEKYYSPAGELLSKDHLHIMYIPAVPDTKHEGFDYKLCADDLTKRAKLKAFHPGLQAHLDSKGIHATVYQKKESSGKTISLSVQQLKELTELTGVSFQKTFTLNDLAAIVAENQTLKKEIASLKRELEKKNKNSTFNRGWNKNKNTEIDV